MKKTITTIAILLGLAIGATAQMSGGGLFQRGETGDSYGDRNSSMPLLPTQHGFTDDQDAESPLEGGAALLFGFAVIYLTRKKDHHD